MFVWIVRFSKIFNIILVIFSSDKVVVYIAHKFIRDVNLWTMYTTTLSDEEMTIIKVADLEKLHNFVVDNFFIWSHLFKENYVWISRIRNLDF
jgi:phenylacetate-coenzyme A ligase PaaK-like adenylate-forming protein